MRVIALAIAVLCAVATPALPQALPYPIDPTAREATPDLTQVPAIRFLTTADYPPFNFRDSSGALVGFNIDLARAICTDLGIACTIQAWPWEQAPRALEDNQGDALIAGLALSPENGALFDFSSIYLMLPGRFVTRREEAGRFNPAALDNRTVAVRRGSAHEQFVRRYLPGAKLAQFDGEVAALQALADRKADAYFGDALRASFWLNEHVDCCDFAGEAYFRPELFGEGLAIAFRPGADAARQAIDYGLVRVKRSGVYDELYLRWFPVSFY